MSYSGSCKTPVGQARTAFERGDRVFQYDHDGDDPAGGDRRDGRLDRAPPDLRPVRDPQRGCAEGWDLVNGSFVFVEARAAEPRQVHDLGQNVAIKGSVVGYYLFRRDEAGAQQVAPNG